MREEKIDLVSIPLSVCFPDQRRACQTSQTQRPARTGVADAPCQDSKKERSVSKWRRTVHNNSFHPASLVKISSGLEPEESEDAATAPAEALTAAAQPVPDGSVEKEGTDDIDSFLELMKEQSVVMAQQEPRAKATKRH